VPLRFSGMNRARLGPESSMGLVLHNGDYLARAPPPATSNLAPKLGRPGSDLPEFFPRAAPA
jgi:hypothetical protein